MILYIIALSLNFMKHIMSIKKIESLCKEAGLSLTSKRREILMVLLEEGQPLSAYDIVERYKMRTQQSIPAMSVYRILDVFITAGIIHKLDSINCYMICDHLSCDHEHLNAQFLICDTCNSVEEITINNQTHELIMSSVDKVGFKMQSLQFELHGTCQYCKQR